MADGIAKGVGEQFGQLGKQVVKDIVSLPVKIIGFDKSAGTNETAGSSGGKPSSGQAQAKGGIKSAEKADPLVKMKQQDEIEKQKQLAQARRLLQQFIEPPKDEQTVREKLEMEELEKKKKEIEEEKKKAATMLPQIAGKPKRGNLYGIKSKQFAGEVGKNVKAQ